VADGHDGVGERGQRRAGDDAHRLPGLQAQRVTRARRDLADDRQHGGRLLGCAGQVDTADGVAVDRRLVEAGQRAARDHLLGAAQAVRLGDRHTHRCRTDRTGQDQGELLVDRPHRHYASHRVTCPAEPDAPCSIATPRRASPAVHEHSRSQGAQAGFPKCPLGVRSLSAAVA
jgi:hypothetical protein